MAFFKFRKGGDDHPTPAAAPQSVEAMRTRARHRLIGASVLVLLGVIGFPLLFDSQAETSQAVEVTVLKKALNLQASAAATLLEAIPQPPSVNLGPLGTRLDTFA